MFLIATKEFENYGLKTINRLSEASLKLFEANVFYQDQSFSAYDV